MFFKNFRYLFFLLFILIEGVIIYLLFNQSIQIDGDISTYLKIIGNDINTEYDIEPFSLIIFKAIGFFPFNFHFLILLFFIYFICIIESWIVFKKTNGSLLWIIFFIIVILPFFHAINLRTGFAIFFLLLFYDKNWGIILTPFFHTSFSPIIYGFKFSLKTFIIILLISVLTGIILFSMISGKLLTYYEYYKESESVLGVLVEIFILFLFHIFLKKKYILKSKLFWYRVFYLILFIALFSFKFAIISSRFITIAYFILLLIRINSIHIKKHNLFEINNLYFYFFFILLITFRFYRISTMFGFY
jgi:hypothetical protein